jgi:type II secretory pathway component GspD/PulD (secretin)
VALVAAAPARGGDPLDAPPIQVQIEVKLVETTLDTLDALGVRIGQYAPETDGDASLGPRTAIEALAGRDGYAYDDAPPFDPDGLGGGPWVGNVEGFAGALFRDSGANVLASPRITTRSEESAQIFVGGRLPSFVDPDGDGRHPGAEEFGLHMGIVPVVGEDGRVRMRIDLTLDRVETPPGATPQLGTRTLETDVRVPDRGTLLIGGLLGDRDRATAGRIPVLGDLPILGQLFRSADYRSGRSDLLVLITPTLYDPATGTSRPAVPSRPTPPVHRPRIDPELKHGPSGNKSPAYPQGYRRP